MMLAQWCSQQGGAHSDKDLVGGDRFGKITAALGFSTWGAVFLAMIAILEKRLRDLFGSMMLEEKNGIGKL